jgi:hypothetical protein
LSGGATGRTLQLFFIDGRPDGMLTAEVFNWTGHVLKVPRTRLPDALAREHARFTGVYLLIGDAQERQQAYIGEAENISKRIGQQDTQKDWWDTAVLVTTTGDSLNKAHVRYLEARLIEEAHNTGVAEMKNGTRPPVPGLSEADRANMEEFLAYLFMVLPAIRVDIFQSQTRPHRTKTATSDQPIFELKMDRHGIWATAILEDGELVVQEGSLARSEWTSGPHSYGTLHRQLVENGVLQSHSDSLLAFAQNYAFKSPSAAAGVILGRPASGPNDWRLKGTNTTYRQWEAQQLGSLGNEVNE